MAGRVVFKFIFSSKFCFLYFYFLMEFLRCIKEVYGMFDKPDSYKQDSWAGTNMVVV